MNFLDPIGYRKENKGQFEVADNDTFNLLLNGKRIGSTNYVTLATAERELKERHLVGFEAKNQPWPLGYEVVAAN